MPCAGEQQQPQQQVDDVVAEVIPDMGMEGEPAQPPRTPKRSSVQMPAELSPQKTLKVESPQQPDIEPTNVDLMQHMQQMFGREEQVS